jgi:hypothetical protein
MRLNRILLAILLSVTFHISVVLTESFAQRNGRDFATFDSVVSWPAWLCSVLVPPGHGIPQLVFPFAFSLAFYAIVFWILLVVYEWRRRKGARIDEEDAASHRE